MKRLKKLFILGALLLSTAGCLKTDRYENITIYTTDYPIYYITNKLYNKHSTIYSIYPEGIDINTYKITNKKISDYSKGQLFIYNGLSSEKDIAAALLNKNKKMDIIDVTKGLEVKNDSTELWLSPANFLMIAQNIKNGLTEFVTSSSILDDIETNYDDLKTIMSELDANLQLAADNAPNKRIIVANNTFKFLEKYGFEVLSISSDGDASNTNLDHASKYFESKQNSYLFMIEGTEETEEIGNLLKKGATKVEIPAMYSLSEDSIKSEEDYLIIINNFIDAIKTEVY